MYEQYYKYVLESLIRGLYKDWTYIPNRSLFWPNCYNNLYIICFRIDESYADM